MSWNNLPPDVQEVAEAVLTEKQLTYWKLDLAGYSADKISLAFQISKPTVREHLQAAYRRLNKAGIREGDNGWTTVDS